MCVHIVTLKLKFSRYISDSQAEIYYANGLLSKEVKPNIYRKPNNGLQSLELNIKRVQSDAPNILYLLLMFNQQCRYNYSINSLSLTQRRGIVGISNVKLCKARLQFWFLVHFWLPQNKGVRLTVGHRGLKTNTSRGQVDGCYDLIPARMWNVYGVCHDKFN